MAESVEAGPSVLDNPLDIELIYSKAQNQWLSRHEICRILQNHKGFPITSAPHNKPPRGSLFLFNKEEQRYFRNDGHNWTKKKDGKTISEGHRPFKVEGFGNLNCYYAHREENRNFLRRCYWMPERDFSHIVLVHYLEETGKREDFSCVKEAQVSGPYSQGEESVDIMPNSNTDSSACPGSHLNNCQVLSVSEYTDTALLTHGAQALEHENAQSDSIHESLSTNPAKESDPTQLNTGNSDTDAELAKLMDDLLRIPIDPSMLEDNWESVTPCGEFIEHGLLSSASRPDTVGELVRNNVVIRLDSGGHLQIQEKSKASVEGSSSLSESACDPTSKFHEQEVNHLELMDSVDPQQKYLDLRNNNSKDNHFQRSLSNGKHGYVLPLDSDGDSKFEGKLIDSSSIGQNLFDGLLTKQGSKKSSCSGDNGETGENENENENDVSSIPCEGRLDIQDINAAENYSDSAEANLILRFDKVLCSGYSATNPVTSSLEEASQLSSKISSLLKGDNKELDQMLKTGSGTEFSSEKVKDQLLQKHLKEKLHVWILQKVAEGGNGPSILDEDGQGVLHLAAALGYDWALEPTIVAGVSVDLRDVNGWTALHWAAFCGREHTVASLISLGAATRALTHPSPKCPSGSTPADLASVNGHKGIAGYLADCSLDVHIPCINLDHQEDLAGPKAVQKISEISAAPLSLGNASDGQSQKDLSATSFRFLERGLETPSIRRRRRPPGAGLALVAVVAMAVMATTIAKIVRCSEAMFNEDSFSLAENLRAEGEKEKEEDKEPDDEGQDDEGQDDERLEGKGPEKDDGPEKDEGPEKKKEAGKKRAPDPALGSGKASKILKAYSAYMALLTAYYIVQSMETIQMLALVCVEASKKTEERMLSLIDVGFEPSAIRV